MRQWRIMRPAIGLHFFKTHDGVSILSRLVRSDRFGKFPAGCDVLFVFKLLPTPVGNEDQYQRDCRADNQWFVVSEKTRELFRC